MCDNCDRFKRLISHFVSEVELAFGPIERMRGPTVAPTDPALRVPESMHKLIGQFRGQLLPNGWDVAKCGEMIARFGTERVTYAMEAALNAGARHWKYVEVVCSSPNPLKADVSKQRVEDPELADFLDQVKQVF